MVKKKKEAEEKRHRDYNQGRLNADRKWTDSIKDRIKELEEQVGIPELRRLLKTTRYTWTD